MKKITGFALLAAMAGVIAFAFKKFREAIV